MTEKKYSTRDQKHSDGDKKHSARDGTLTQEEQLVVLVPACLSGV